VREKFQQRFMPLWKATKGVTVAGTDRLTDRVLELLDADEINVRQAERMAGYIALRQALRHRARQAQDFDADTGELLEDARGRHHSRATRYRREAELLDVGLVPADEAGTEVTVDLHEVLETVLGSDAWERKG